MHLAAKAGVRPSIVHPAAYMRANVEGTAAIVEAMRATGTKRLVFASSSLVYGNSTHAPFREDAFALEPISAYAASKRSAELLLSSVARLFGLRVAALRLFTVFGPRQRPDLAIHTFARRMMAGDPLVLFGDGTQARDYTYCDDIVSGIIAATDWTETAGVGVELFNLGGSQPIPLTRMVSVLAEALGVSPSLEWRPMQPGDVEQTYADLAKSSAILGYQPQVAFGTGIARFADWYQAMNADGR